MKLILVVGFSGILGTGWVEDRKMIKDKLTDEKQILSRFRGKLRKMIKDAGSKFDDYIQFRLKLDRFCCIGVMN